MIVIRNDKPALMPGSANAPPEPRHETHRETGGKSLGTSSQKKSGQPFPGDGAVTKATEVKEATEAKEVRDTTDTVVHDDDAIDIERLIFDPEYRGYIRDALNRKAAGQDDG